MMLGGKDKVLHTCIFGKADPLIRVKIHRVKALCKSAILLVGDRHETLDPLGIILNSSAPILTRQQRVQPPMGHHAVARLFEPLFVIHISAPFSIWDIVAWRIWLVNKGTVAF